MCERKNSCRHSQLVGPRFCRALVSEKDAGWRAAPLVRAAFRIGRGKLDVLFRARNAKSTPELQEALLKTFLHPISMIRSAGKLGVLLLQLSPAFSPRKHQLNELKPLIEMLNGYELAIEFRNRNWAIGDQLQATIDFVRKHRAIFVNVDAPPSEHFTVMRSDVDEVTNSNVAYLR